MELQKINLAKTTPAADPKVVPVQEVKPPITNVSMNSDPFFTLPKIIGFVVVLVLGFGSGYLLKNGSIGGVINTGSVVSRNVPEAGLKEGDIIGVQDEKTFKDSVTGVLHKGGIDGEGSHQLLRPGGVSQTVYLTSSVIDLDEFEGHQVTVWGETFKGQKAGWLMDVGRVKVEKLNAPDPE